MRTRLLEGIVLSVLVAAVFWQPLQRNLELREYTDFLYHAGLAAEQLRTGALNTGYFLFHWAAIAASFVAGSMEQAAVLVVLASRVATALIVLWFFGLATTGLAPRLAAWAIVIAAMVVTPITLFTITVYNTYSGYIGINTHHNPTTEVLRPLALGSFIALGAWFDRPERRLLWLFGGLTALSVIAKPSYALCLYPALLFFVPFAFPPHERVRRGAALALALAPTVAIQVLQFYAYYGESSDSAIVFEPFAVLHEPIAVLVAKLAASIAFPLAVLWLFPREAGGDIYLRFGWRLLGAGLLLHVLLAESGPRMMHGNFGWSSQIALFLVFVAALRVWARVLFRAEPAPPTYRLLASTLVLALHLASGIVYLSLYWRGFGGRGWW
jgi:hypothetical protein